MNSSVQANLDDETGIIEVTVAGRWDRRLWAHTHSVLRKAMAEHPAGLLLDLRHLVDPLPGSAPLWIATSVQARRAEPAVPVALVLGQATALAAKLERVGIRRYLPTYTDIVEARSALTSRRPMTDQIHLRLPPEPSAAASAREVVAVACEQWNLPGVLERARLVASELVTNAVEHAGTRIDLVLTRLGAPGRAGLRRLAGCA